MKTKKHEIRCHKADVKFLSEMAKELEDRRKRGSTPMMAIPFFLSVDTRGGGLQGLTGRKPYQWDAFEDLPVAVRMKALLEFPRVIGDDVAKLVAEGEATVEKVCSGLVETEAKEFRALLDAANLLKHREEEEESK